MRFEMPERNRQEARVASVLLGLIVVGSVVAFGCTGSGGEPESTSRLRVSGETPVRPASTTIESSTTAPVIDGNGGSAVGGEGKVAGEVGTMTVIPENVSFEDGEAAFRAGDYDRAVGLFGAYVDRKPGNAWGHYMLGLSARRAGDPERATAAFERALELDPGHLKSHFNLGRALLTLDRPEEALAEFETGVELAPESGEGYRLVGRAYERLGDTEGALAAYQDALALDDGDAWSMNNMGLILIGAGRSEDALAPLARAAELRSDLAVVRNNLGMALELTGHFSQAAEAYRQALGVDPGYAKAQGNLARVEGVRDRPGLERVDLPGAATRFRESIEEWRDPETDESLEQPADSQTLVRDTAAAIMDQSVVVGEAPETEWR